MGAVEIPRLQTGEVVVKYRWRATLVNLVTGQQQGILVPPGVKTLTLAIPDNEAPYPVDPRSLMAAVGPDGSLKELPPGQEHKALPAEGPLRCPDCGSKLIVCDDCGCHLNRSV
jgi:hypothetical protein